MIALLKNQEHFNWDVLPLTSVSMKDSAFVTTRGNYQGNASWSGNVWTLINEMVVRGLSDCGEKELAAELAYKTICALNHNCAEFLNPFDGSGHGVVQYAWTASQYLELLIETVFGVAYRAGDRTVVVCPSLTEGMRKECFSIRKLRIADDIFMDIAIDHGVASCTVSDDSIRVEVKNGLQ